MVGVHEPGVAEGIKLSGADVMIGTVELDDPGAGVDEAATVAIGVWGVNKVAATMVEDNGELVLESDD
jgi:hypothetical protein